MKISQNKGVILGIDPGLANMGYAVIDINNNNAKLITYGIVTTDKKNNFPKRLDKIYNGILTLINKYCPVCLAIESLYFCKNVKSALQVGQSKGVILLSAQHKNIPVYEYTPLQIKQSVCGYGKADKKQVQEMVKVLLKMPVIPKPDHAADALAAALCCFSDCSRRFYD
jgi:crossover junction endodeoxyribonuclease RuvC